jgi:hypothetical protein
MTIFEFFPWFIAIGITVVSAVLLVNKAGVPSLLAWIIALALGFVSWASYWLVLKRLSSRFHQRRDKNSRRELEKRTYQELDAAKNYPVAENLYYECLVCGNVLPSMPRENASCMCRNILVNASLGRIEIRDHVKTKLFVNSPRQPKHARCQ